MDTIRRIQQSVVMSVFFQLFFEAVSISSKYKDRTDNFANQNRLF